MQNWRKIGRFGPEMWRPKYLGSAGVCLRRKTHLLGFSGPCFNGRKQLRYRSWYFWVREFCPFVNHSRPCRRSLAASGRRVTNYNFSKRLGIVLPWHSLRGDGEARRRSEMAWIQRNIKQAFKKKKKN